MNKLYFFLGLCIFTVAANATVYYVKPGGTGDGSSWANAVGNIRHACEAAGYSGDEVRVAQGTYQFDGTTIQLVAGVTLKGGYTGDGDEVSGDASLTIFDASGIPVADATPFIESLTPTDDRSIVSGITFQGSKGGALVIRANTTLDNVIVKDNEISADGSAGVRVKLDFDGQEIRILNSQFSGNKITLRDAGAAIAVGGGSDEVGVADVLIKNCLIKENEAAVGSGGNWSAGISFGAYISESVKLNVVNTVFDSNSGISTGSGGTSYASAAIGTINSSSSNVSNVVLNIINCTLVNNTNSRPDDPTGNSAALHFRYMKANIYNTVCIGTTNGTTNNANANVYRGSSSKGVTISYSAYPSGTVTSSAVGNGNITSGIGALADVFAPDSYIPFATSPLVDAGSDVAGQFSDTDFLGKVIYGSKRDIGAYEYTGGTGLKPVVETGNVVATYYFNLQGVKIKAPTQNGIYLVKRVYDNGQAVTSKELTVKK